MSKYRNSYDTMVQILKRTRESPCYKTYLQYAIRSTGTSGSRYIAILVRSKLLVITDSIYHITQDGLDAIQHYDKLVELVGQENG